MTALLHLLVRQNNESEPIIVPIPIPIPINVPEHAANGVRHGKPVIAFIIGLSIIILASVLNAAGLNLTKLDHVIFLRCITSDSPANRLLTLSQVRTSAVPKSERKRDLLRPLWLLGMLLYM